MSITYTYNAISKVGDYLLHMGIIIKCKTDSHTVFLLMDISLSFQDESHKTSLLLTLKVYKVVWVIVQKYCKKPNIYSFSPFIHKTQLS